MTSASRKFLVVSDETEECLTAAMFAAMRAKAVRAGLVMLRCARTPALGGWVGLDREISQDALDSARLKALQHADRVESRVGLRPEVIVYEDEPLDAIRRLVASDASIKTIVLAAGSGRWGPGPLVSRLGQGKTLTTRPVAVTIIPGVLSAAQLDELAGQVE
jgi:nucleotide-binding universal stress UspA family protein